MTDEHKAVLQDIGFSERWIAGAKAVCTLVAISVPLVVALMAWLVSNSYALSRSVGLLEYKVSSEGPRYTATEAQLDRLKDRQQIGSEFKATVDPIIAELQRLTFKMESLERQLSNMQDKSS